MTKEIVEPVKVKETIKDFPVLETFPEKKIGDHKQIAKDIIALLLGSDYHV